MSTEAWTYSSFYAMLGKLTSVSKTAVKTVFFKRFVMKVLSHHIGVSVFFAHLLACQNPEFGAARQQMSDQKGDSKSQDEAITSITHNGLIAIKCGSLADCQPYDVCFQNAKVYCSPQNHCESLHEGYGKTQIDCIVEVYLGKNPTVTPPADPCSGSCGPKTHCVQGQCIADDLCLTNPCIQGEYGFVCETLNNQPICIPCAAKIDCGSLGGHCAVSANQPYCIADDHCKNQSCPQGLACNPQLPYSNCALCSSQQSCPTGQHCETNSGQATCVPDAANPSPPANNVCGKVEPPIEVVVGANDRSYCNFFKKKPSEATWVTPWMGITADTPGGTIEILDLTVYGIMQNGTIEVIAGTQAGKPTVTWAGHYHRSQVGWFDPPEKVADVKPISGTTYPVPTNPYVLHLGNEGADVSKYEEVITFVTVRTTGDVKADVGEDYKYFKDVPFGADKGGGYAEGGVSNFMSCNTGSKISFHTPWSAEPTNCEGPISPSMPSQSPPPNGNGFPGGGPFTIKVAPWVMEMCGGKTEIRTWDVSGGEHSSFDSFLAFDPGTKSGSWWWNLFCNKEPWGAKWGWDGTSIRHVTDFGGITVTMNGVDISSQVRICHNAYDPSKSVPFHQPRIGLDIYNFDQCP